jgi:hypothetical protein
MARGKENRSRCCPALLGGGGVVLLGEGLEFRVVAWDVSPWADRRGGQQEAARGCDEHDMAIHGEELLKRLQ